LEGKVSFGFITRRLATGGAIRSADDASALLAAGVTHVLNVANDAEDGLLAARATCFANPTDDVEPRQPKPAEWFDRSLRFAMPILCFPGATLYVHCAEGLNRGPSTAYAILRAWGLGAQVAEGLIRTARPQVQLSYMKDADAALVALGWWK
jgi:hypothetical protein